MELWQCVIAVSTEQEVEKFTLAMIPLLSKSQEMGPAYLPVLTRIKGLIDIHSYVLLSLSRLLHLRADLKGEGGGKKENLWERVI